MTTAQRIARFVRTASPFSILAVTMLAGFGLCLLSVVLNIHLIVTDKGNGILRQVGYLHSLNWSLNYTVIFPLAAFFMISATQDVVRVLSRLEERGMLRRPDNGLATKEALLAAWAKLTPNMQWLIPLFVAVSGALALFEWASNNLAPLITGDFEQNKPVIDWGLAALIRDTGRSFRVANAGFDLLAFALEAVLLASLFVFFWMMISFQALIKSSDDHGVTIIPDLGSDDKTREPRGCHLDRARVPVSGRLDHRRAMRGDRCQAQAGSRGARRRPVRPRCPPISSASRSM